LKSWTNVATRIGEQSGEFIVNLPDNPNLARLINRVVQHIQNNTLNNVFEITGPGV
jgi:hypothetical protein